MSGDGVPAADKVVAFYTEREDEAARLEGPVGRAEFAR
jgi:hypothetical protein